MIRWISKDIFNWNLVYVELSVNLNWGIGELGNFGIGELILELGSDQANFSKNWIIKAKIEIRDKY